LSLEGFQKTGKNDWLAALDARMGEIYLGGYHVNKVNGLYEIASLLDEASDKAIGFWYHLHTVLKVSGLVGVMRRN